MKIKFTPLQAETIGQVYYNVKNALELVQAFNREVPAQVQSYSCSWAADLRILVDKMNRRLNCNQLFETQVKENDTLRLNEINRLFVRLTPQKQELVEALVNALDKGEPISIECS